MALTPRFWYLFHCVLTAAWCALVAPTLLWWRESVLWVALMSLWANIASHAAAAQAAHIEAKEVKAESYRPRPAARAVPLIRPRRLRSRGYPGDGRVRG